jgi:hypothetical protein
MTNVAQLSPQIRKPRGVPVPPGRAEQKLSQCDLGDCIHSPSHMAAVGIAARVARLHEIGKNVGIEKNRIRKVRSLVHLRLL